MGAKWYETEADGISVESAYESARSTALAGWGDRDLFETGTILETTQFEVILCADDETPRVLCRSLCDKRWGWKGHVAAAVQLTSTRWLFCGWARY